MNGFSISQYRNANRLRLFFSEKGKQSVEVFKALYMGGIDYSFQLETGGFNNLLVNAYNTLFNNPLSRATARGMMGEDAFSVMDTPLKPFIEGVKPLSHSFECFLPLLDTDSTGKIPNNPYQDNIIGQVEKLLKYVLPGHKNIQDALNSGTSGGNNGSSYNSLDEFIKDQIKRFFPESSTNGTSNVEETFNTLWSFANKVATQWWNDFAAEAYFLTEPLQFVTDNKIYIRIGDDNPINGYPLYVTGVNVALGPNVYSDGGRAYPAFAKVKLDVMRRDKPTAQYSLDAVYGKVDYVDSPVTNKKDPNSNYFA